MNLSEEESSLQVLPDPGTLGHAPAPVGLNGVAEHQHYRRPLWGHGGAGQNEDPSQIILIKTTKPQTTNVTEHPSPLAHVGDCCFLARQH